MKNQEKSFSMVLLFVLAIFVISLWWFVPKKTAQRLVPRSANGSIDYGAVVVNG